MDREKEKILGVTKEQIEKKFGKGSLMKLGEHAATDQVAAIHAKEGDRKEWSQDELLKLP